MKKYNVTLIREIHDYQTRTVEIEAESPEAAEVAAHDMTNTDDDFWANAKTEVGHNDSPTVESCEEIVAGA